MTIREKFNATDGVVVHAEQNSENYSEDAPLYLKVGHASGVTLSLKETTRLRDFLTEVLEANAALKPKVAEEIKKLSVGTIFKTVDLENKYIRLEGDKIYSLHYGMDLQIQDFSGVKAVEILYDPSK